MSETERNARVDAAWKAASRDEPPAALDVAIGAAARQAVGARPRRARDKHWWYPFAAAATVAVIAVGLLQVTPPEPVAPTTDAVQAMKQESPVVAAAPATPPEPGTTSTAIPATRSSNVALPSPAPLKKEKDLRSGDGARAAGSASDAQRERAAPDKLERAIGPSPVENKPAPTKAPPPAQAQPAPPPVAARVAEPFPGGPQLAAQSEVARRDAAPASPSEAVAASGPVPTPSSAAPQSRDELPDTKAEESRPKRQAMVSANAGMMKTATPRSAEDWIKLIRELRNEGRIDEASKELVAFRSAYGARADSLLPQDLREFEARTTAPAAK
jgi:hypothetical protein